MKKKFLSLLCAAAMMCSLAACGTATDAAYAGQTLTGRVTAIDGTTVTMQLGELTETAAPTDNSGSGDSQQPTGTPPEKPDGDSTDSAQQPPEMPDGDGSSQQGAAPLEKPDGDTSTDSSQQPPEMPSGDSQNGQGGTPPDMPGGMTGGTSFTEGDETAAVELSKAAITRDGETVTASHVAVDDILTVTFDDSGIAAKAEIVTVGGGMGGPGGSFGGSGTVTQGDSANTISENGAYSDTTYTSTGDDENALRIDGADVTLDGVTVDKSSGATSNTENGDFYGVNAALLATNGANVTITNAKVTSAAQNGNGVFSYGAGTTISISNSVIATTADNSGGIQTTGGGTTIASGLIVTTSGNSSAAIRSDRGGGTVSVDGGSYVSNGYNSPAVYSTADITVKNATLTANNSEALVIEGKNSIVLEDCDVTGSMSDTKGTSSDENVHNVMIYQSMSGDADVGTSAFSMTGGTLTGKNGDMIYVTNTHCVLTLSGVTIQNEDTDGVLLRVAGNSASHGWGTAGSNGAQVEFTADGQVLTGDIAVDTISTLNMKLTNGSSFTGAINIVDNAQGGTAVSDNAAVTIDSGCTWTLTGNCTLTSLTNNGTIHFNGYTITLADGTVLR